MDVSTKALSGSNALVIGGGGGGIGRAITRGLARAGSAVAVADVDRQRAEEAPSEVADAAVFLASPLSSYVTGQNLVIDGGATAIGPFSSSTRRQR